ncbi:MAG: glycine cleavage system protein GcvH [Planctomycetes bacterium]|nr:glycine cleavage system protein GcvH [Planctomycetota bacterium]
MIPDNLLFTEEHEWLRVSDEHDYAYIGISDFAQEQLGEIVYVELPEVGDSISAGDEFGSIESVKASSELYSAISGEVIEVNASLADTPEMVNQSPYDDGWMIKVKLDDFSETHGLMDSEAYEYHMQRSERGEEPLDHLDEEVEED